MERRSIHANPARRRRPENNPNAAKKSQVCHLTRRCFSRHPSVHPSIPACLNSICILFSHQTSRSLLCALSLSSAAPGSRYLMFLSTLLIPHLHPIQAGGFRRGAGGGRDALPRLSTQTRRVPFESHRPGGNTKRIQA